MQENTIRTGNQLQNGKYRIESILGQGGFGITYLATLTFLNKKVAIKEFFLSGYCVRQTGKNTIAPQSLPIEKYAEFKEKFLDEARIISQFDHPSIVKVTDIFEENNTAYFVMEYIEGTTLAQMIKQKGKLTENEAINYIIQSANALQIVHDKGILHRDIKPENIIITTQGVAKLIDFGTARQFTQDKTIAQTSIVTAGYAPIEQYSDRHKRGSYTDIYALGATLYACLTGKDPIPATDRLNESLKPVNGISPYINRVIIKAMEMKSDDRYQTINEFLNALIGSNADDSEITDTIQNQVSKTSHKTPDDNTANDLHDGKTQIYTTPKKNRKKIILTSVLIIVLAVIIGSAIYYYIKIYKPENNNSDLDNTEQQDNKTNPSAMLPGKYPFASMRYLTPDDLHHRTKEELQLMRNEIYARHGYTFHTPDLQSYFHKQKWYKPLHDNEAVVKKLTATERKNIRLIKKYEEQLYDK